jgi:serpin B
MLNRFTTICGVVPTLFMCVNSFASPASPPASDDPGTLNSSAELLGLASSVFATDLLRAVRASGETGNVFISPSSVHAALAMARVGAGTRTREELSRVMRIDQVSGRAAITDETFRHFATLLTNQANAPRRDWDPEGAQRLTLTQAAALWASKDSGLKPGASASLQHLFQSPTTLLDFTKPGKTADKINDWASTHTRKRITRVVEPGDIPASGLILTTAIYFKASWFEQFDRVSDMTFTAGGKPRAVATMMNEGNFAYARITDGQVAWIPYFGHAEMMIVLPDEGKFEQAIAGLDLASIKREQPGRPVIATLPLFSLNSNLQLAKPLGAMGLSTAMDPSAADFTGFTDVKPTYIDKVVHIANCDVDEKGTEAAAVTAMIMVTGAPVQQEPPKPIEFKADRPFVFFIRHSSGVVLFAGVVADPIAPKAK